jgi:hypothetical protein
MSKHGRVIISRMIELIGECEAGRLGLRALLDDLGSMYQSLDPAEQPAEREWLDAIVPLDRAVTEREEHDRQEIRPQIVVHLAHLRQMLVRPHDQ